MKLTRREFVKTNAIAATASVAGITIPGIKEAIAGDDTIRWDKAACRFCGTGCKVWLGLKNGKPAVIRGEKDSAINFGFLCMKGMLFYKLFKLCII